MTNIITWSCIENTSPWTGFELLLVVISTDFPLLNDIQFNVFLNHNYVSPRNTTAHVTSRPESVEEAAEVNRKMGRGISEVDRKVGEESSFINWQATKCPPTTIPCPPLLYAIRVWSKKICINLHKFGLVMRI